MTRQEAIAYVISTGNPITHKLFGKNEYVYYNDSEMRDEEGTFLDWEEFWSIRKGGEWEDGWFKLK